MKYRHSECVAIATACLFMVLFAYAGPKDFWETKPYTEWTLKEVEKILQNKSPWTQTHLLDTAPGSVQMGTPREGAAGKGEGTLPPK